MTLYYQDSSLTVYHGRMEEHQDVGGDVLITDPSYGTRLYETDLPWDPLYLAQWVGRFQSVAVMAYPEILAAWCVRARVEPDEWITWAPTNKQGARSSRVPRSSEHIAVFGSTPGSKLLRRPRSTASAQIMDRARMRSAIKIQDVAGKSTRDWATLGDVWTDAAPGIGFNFHRRKHRNEKPLSLGQKLITLCSLPGQTVVDYFAGSGVFSRAAVDLGRKAIAVEMDEKNCETLVKRFQQGVLI